MQDNTHKNFTEYPQEKTYYQMRCDFYEKFKNEISPKLRYYENKRKKERKKAILLTTFSVILAILFFFLAIHLLTFIFIASAVISNVYIRKSFEGKIKSLIMPLICSCYGDLQWCNLSPVAALNFALSKNKQNNNFKYNIDVNSINNSLIVPYYDSSSYDDIFWGSYKNVPYEIIEASYSKEEGTGKDRRNITIFDGVIVKLKMNKSFNCHTVVRPDGLFHTSPSCRLKHTELEDVNFEKKFDVFCDDEIEARYLLTPSFMERLTNLKTSFFAEKISCAFYEDYLFIALRTSKDLFSIASLNKPLYEFRQYEILHDEIISIIKLIDHFKLSEKTGL